MSAKREPGRYTSGSTEAACTGSGTISRTDPHVKRMLYIAAACARLASRSTYMDDHAIAVAREAMRQLECEIALAVERIRMERAMDEKAKK